MYVMFQDLILYFSKLLYFIMIKKFLVFFSSWVVAFLYILAYLLVIVYIFWKSRTFKTDGIVVLPSVNENKDDEVTVVTGNKRSVTNQRISNANNIDDEVNLQGRRSSGTVDLTKLHNITHTSTWQGAPSSLWHSLIAFVHSCDTGLHLGKWTSIATILTNLVNLKKKGINFKKKKKKGLIASLIEESKEWNLAQQYLLAALCIWIFYRVSSFVMIWVYLPRYSYTKTVSGNRALLSNAIALSGPTVNLSGITSAHAMHYKSDHACWSYLNYCWLQLLFDAGYLLELAPWLFNWDYTRILVPEFAWFCKVRSLTESFPFSLLVVTFLMYRENTQLFRSDLHVLAALSLCVSLLAIILTLLLYDETALTLDSGESYWKIRSCNLLYRLFQVVSRVLILAFFIALFPWWALFLIILIPLVANFRPFKLGRTDNEVYNFIYQSLLAFPDYSSPFGRISLRENFLTRLGPFHFAILSILGSPLMFIRFFVECFANKFLQMNRMIGWDISINVSHIYLFIYIQIYIYIYIYIYLFTLYVVNDNVSLYVCHEYASFVISTYTVSRFVESIFELIFIGVELYGTGRLHKASVDVRSNFAITSYWIALLSTFLFLITFVPIRYEFVKDNTADETRALAASQAGKAAFVQTNEEYNTDKSGGPRRSSHRTSDVLTKILPVGLDAHTCRQRLLQRQFWRAIHRNNYKELNWLLRSRQHINLFEPNDQEQIGIIVLGLRYDWACVRLMVKNGGGLRHLCRYAAFHGDIEILKFVHYQLHVDVTTLHDEFDELLLFSAVEGSQSSIVRFLADLNADLAAKNGQGDSALLLAAQK
ncbi:hypothetical protein RFI_05366, partial [Reticulomyxa filosa]